MAIVLSGTAAFRMTTLLIWFVLNRFKVEDMASRFHDVVTAWACIRLSRLQEGYRTIDLYDMQGSKVENGKLFVIVEKRLR